jgi:H+-translocating NAD(P) transhydrogenase subunit alpha
MQIGFPAESSSLEPRTACTPTSVKRLVKLGAEVIVECGVGLRAGFRDEDYQAAGAVVTSDRRKILTQSTMILRVRKPPEEEVGLQASGSIHVSFLDPFHESALLDKLAESGISAISMEMIPRSTRAQKMDALTSQANLAGYVAVMLGAVHLNKILPMMSTAAGTLLPARVFVIGAGVAGLQAIATARRLGAKVEAFDTRPVVAEQVQSLGAKFVEIDLGGETGQTAQGYAVELTPEQIARQREGMKKCCADADLVITTAQVFGRKAPTLVTADMVAAMKPGSVIMDMALESGGNVEGSVAHEATQIGGVTILGHTNLAGRVAQNASQVYATNLVGLIEEFWKEGSFTINLDDDILKNCVITHGGHVQHEKFKKS